MGAHLANKDKSHHIELLISQDAIARRIAETCAELDRLYKQEELVIVMIMKGSLCLVADMIRCLQIPTHIEFVQAKSYGLKGAERGALTILGIESLSLEGRNVLVVDDIFDSGTTMGAVLTHIQEQSPKSLRSLVLLSKKMPRSTKKIPDFVLFEIENQFVVGFGMDYKEFYRGLPGIYIFKG